MSWLDSLNFDHAGLVPVIAQDTAGGAVLMLAWANREALERTAASGRAHYWSRSRAELWRKGDTSGHIQSVREIRVDCDGDAVVYLVEQTGPACHTGEPTCFSRQVVDDQLQPAPTAAHILSRLEAIVAERDARRPEGSYTTYLLEQGVDKVLKKVGEEATEVVIAAKNEDSSALRAEAADLLFHLVVLLRQRGLPLAEVWAILEDRFGAQSRIPGARPVSPHS